MKKYISNKQRNIFILIASLILLIMMTMIMYIYTTPIFERELPKITIEEKIIWNYKTPLNLKISDNEGLKNFQVTLSDGVNNVIIESGEFKEVVKEKTILIEYPKDKILNSKVAQLTLKILANDNSSWNFFDGNKIEKVVNINIDYIRPNINILSNSYSITQGGSGLVIFKADDINLKEVYIKVDDRKFKVQPYKKEGYYAGLVAWPFNQKSFSAKIIATDIAQNSRITDIPFYTKKRKYRTSWIRARDKFIDGKITDLASTDANYANSDNKIDKFVAVNETMRLNNEKVIHALSQVVSSELLNSWKMKRFYPLKSAQKVASYGDERHYYYKTKSNEISKSYHVGLDLASTKMATIRTSNSGRVVYTEDNGIYGNMPMIDHGLGLYSIYGHCSQFLVQEGDEVKAGDAIAKTGMSGLALGDHLHFGLILQGVEVRPAEWFDKSWIRKNIDNIFKTADKIILDK